MLSYTCGAAERNFLTALRRSMVNPATRCSQMCQARGGYIAECFGKCARDRRKPDIAVAIVRGRLITFSQASTSLRTAGTEKPLMMDKSDMIRPNCGANPPGCANFAPR